jgi:PIN domain nuclease of toxin-antitoxin system
MYLLDTFALVSLLSAPFRMKPTARELVGAQIDKTFFSPASIWEIEIKIRIGKLTKPASDVIDAARAQGYLDLPITAEHAMAAGQLPLIHKDPFDRMLIAQAFREGLTIVSPDTKFSDYGVHLLLC